MFLLLGHEPFVLDKFKGIARASWARLTSFHLLEIVSLHEIIESMSLLHLYGSQRVIIQGLVTA